MVEHNLGMTAVSVDFSDLQVDTSVPSTEDNIILDVQISCPVYENTEVVFSEEDVHYGDNILTTEEVILDEPETVSVLLPHLEEDDLDVAEVNFVEEPTRVTNKNGLLSVEGPCFIVDNIRFQEQLKYVSDDSGLSVYFFDGTYYTSVGTIEPTLANIRRLKYLEFGIYFRNTAGEELDLYDPQTLYKFVSL